MRHKSLKQWVLVVRPWAFPASVMPALIGIAYVFLRNHQDGVGAAHWIYGVLALVGAVLFHGAGNLMGDYFDYRHGVDSKNNINQTNRMIIEGIFSPQEVLLYGFGLLVAGSAIGFFFVYTCGLPILLIGLIGLLLTIFYYRTKYVALGDLNIFISFGLLIALGTATVVSGRIMWNVLPISASAGFLIVAILHANNTRDIPTDTAAGIRTFAMLIGRKWAKVYYALLLLGAYALVLFNIAVSNLPWLALLPFISLPLAVANIRRMFAFEHSEAIIDLDAATAQLVALFSALLVISMLISGVL